MKNFNIFIELFNFIFAIIIFLNKCIRYIQKYLPKLYKIWYFIFTTKDLKKF